MNIDEFTEVSRGFKDTTHYHGWDRSGDADVVENLINFTAVELFKMEVVGLDETDFLL